MCHNFIKTIADFHNFISDSGFIWIAGFLDVWIAGFGEFLMSFSDDGKCGWELGPVALKWTNFEAMDR